MRIEDIRLEEMITDHKEIEEREEIKQELLAENLL